MKKLTTLFLLSFFLLIYAEKIKFKVHWYPQAQFAGYILAQEKGFFKDDNLDVELFFSQGNDNIIRELKEGEVQYCTAWLSEAISKNNNKNLICVMQILQQSSLMLVSRKYANINKPQDLNGKKVRLWGGNFSVPFKAFINKYKLDFEEVAGSYNIDLFLSGACEATSAMYYNEYNKLYLAGLNFDELNAIKFSEDSDLNFPEDGIYVTKTYLKNHSAEVGKMKKAITKGWEYASSHQKETVKIILKYCDKWKLKTNYSEQKWMLEKILEAAQPGENFGKLKIEQYYKVQEELLKQNIVLENIRYSDFVQGGNND